ncbi:DUF6338 family protein [Phenylobacterium sp.]|uniref:DUF6338 family protein n=1 Tax=Phenylobacterium sp. TaxID=1871053 RepID=UPI002F3E61C3
MDDIAKLVALTLPQFAALVALFLPGFVSIKVDRLMQPGKRSTGADFIVDALAYSLLNAAVFAWAVRRVSQELNGASTNYPLVWALGVLVCVLGPAIWPPLFRVLQRLGARRGWLLPPHHVAWDNYFTRHEPCWVIVHLKNGKLVGGYFGSKSFASVEPDSGHIYLEALWKLDRNGHFTTPVTESNGALFRPEDYDWIEFFRDE